MSSPSSASRAGAQAAAPYLEERLLIGAVQCHLHVVGQRLPSIAPLPVAPQVLRLARKSRWSSIHTGCCGKAGSRRVRVGTKWRGFWRAVSRGMLLDELAHHPAFPQVS